METVEQQDPFEVPGAQTPDNSDSQSPDNPDTQSSDNPDTESPDKSYHINNSKSR